MSGSQLSGRHCLVTGGAGFIGSHVASKLLEQGAYVTVLDNFSTGFEANLTAIRQVDGEHRLTFHQTDAADPAAVSIAMEGIDYVFHLAAMASVPRSMREPELCHAWTATSTVVLLQAALAARVKRFVLSSTSAVYGDSTFVSKRESDPVAPLSPYAAAKLASENYLAAFQKMGLETVTLRYFNVFGPRQDPQSEYSAVIPRFVSLVLDGKRPIVYGDGEQSRDFVHVDDVVAVNLAAATHPNAPGGVFNVGRGESTTLLQLLDELRGLMGKTIDPDFQPARAGDVRQSLADISLLRNRLGFEPSVSMADGLHDSIAYYRSLFE
ncbi:MAG: SDR family oxidoreductase [Planctomycetota bacterium]